MSQQYSASPGPASTAPVSRLDASAQRAFMTRVYAHLLLAIGLLVGLEYLLFTSGIAEAFVGLVIDTSWLLVLGGFMVASWLAQRATSARSRGVQYAGLFGLVAAYALIFTPLLWVAVATQPGAIGLAAVVTLVGFVALSGIAITTAVDFSFLRSLVMWGGLVALGLIVLGVVAGLELGTWFSVGMIALAGGAVLYDTQRIHRSLPAGREVGAAASLFGSVAMMFYYVLRLFLRR